MKSVTRKIEIEFTEEPITSSARSVFLSEAAGRLGLRKLLESALKLKRRRCGLSDAEIRLSLIYTAGSRRRLSLRCIPFEGKHCPL